MSGSLCFGFVLHGLILLSDMAWVVNICLELSEVFTCILRSTFRILASSLSRTETVTLTKFSLTLIYGIVKSIAEAYNQESLMLGGPRQFKK